jgi:L-histidine Nalpha-methyltransferase
MFNYTTTTAVPLSRDTFFKDILTGLMATPKHLSSKYFYDAVGDELFKEIMASPEYYLTDCELEIMETRSSDIVQAIRSASGGFASGFDLIELGPGDATKTIYLLKELMDHHMDFTYYPVDISGHVIQSLERTLPHYLPGLQMNGLHGEYIDMLQEAGELSRRPKVVLFMGANIGNFDYYAALSFCESIREQLHPGDLMMTGFDLRKHPSTILSAYNDAGGITRAFNLNLLHRINMELDADFNLVKFDHYPTYDPLTGSCKSFLISLEKQRVRFGKNAVVDFAENEPIFMEISQKYSREEIDRLAAQSGFMPVAHFEDHKKWFVDSLWTILP